MRTGHLCSHTLLHVHPQLTSKLLPEDVGTKHAYTSHHRQSYHRDNCPLLSGSVFFTAWSRDGNFWSGHCFRLALQSFLLSFCWAVSTVSICCYRERPPNIIWQAVVTDNGMISIWVCFICVSCLSSLFSRVCVAAATSGVSCNGGGWGGGCRIAFDMLLWQLMEWSVAGHFCPYAVQQSVLVTVSVCSVFCDVGSLITKLQAGWTVHRPTS